MSSFELDEDFVRKLADLLKETGLNEIEYAEGEKRIRVAAGATAIVSGASATSVTAIPADTPAEKNEESASGTPVEAPMVGTAYLSPEPGTAPFIKVGDEIRAGDTLLIIEAMKVMNPIKAPVGGIVKKILVGDAKPVEFGETLLLIA